jgi:hypothetical protein
VILCDHRFPEDGTPVPKYIEVILSRIVFHEVYFIVFFEVLLFFSVSTI